MRRGVRSILPIVAFIALVAGGSAARLIDRYQGPGPLHSATAVIVPKGAPVSEIAQLLSDANVITDRLMFRLSARLQRADGSLRPGEYQFPPEVSMRRVLAMLRAGETVVRRLTIPEGLSSQQVIALVQQAEGLDGGVAALPGEGALLPETYNYEWGDSRSEMINRMAAAMTSTLDELWANRADGLPLASPREALILASIVEKETGVQQERPHVAAVFLNRLRLGMKLQADPTVTYSVYGGGVQARPLNSADLQHVSPYNTYITEGLPPGPIANPGRPSLQAVLRPAPSDDLFFVADGSGGHAFAKTLAEHQHNVAQWRKLNAKSD